MYPENLAEITFTMNNEAFGDDYRAEACRILRDIADKVEGGREGGIVMDVNGNRIGAWDVCKEPQ